MANSLLIEKQTGGYFKFTLNGDTANAITSIQNDLLAVGNQLHFKTGNGANIIKEQFIYPEDVTIVSGGTFTFTTVAQVWDKLIDIDYFAWLGGGGGGIGIDRFDDLVDTFKYTGNAGKTVIVDNSELRLVPVTLYNKRLFTELEDTPSALVPNKMVVVNSAGDALILKDQPEAPETLLNSVGYFDYNDLITQTVPLNAVSNVALKLTNDSEGANTSTDQNPYGVSYVWDYTTNQFNFSELSVGDTIDVRIHLQVTTTSANQRVLLSAKLGIGSISEFTNIIYENQFKSAGLHEINFVAPFYIGSTYISDNPAELYLTTDASATVKVDGWYVRIIRKDINIVTVDYTVPDATTLAKGIVRLAGDLGGTANSPTVPGLVNKVPTSRTIGTTSPLLGGGALSSDLTLSIQQANSTESGYLSYVDWTTFNNKASDSNVVHLTGAETITGLKTFSADLNISDLYINGYSGTSGRLSLKQANSAGFSGIGYTTINALGTSTLVLNFRQSDGTNKTMQISANLIGSVQRGFQFPDADGTVALTSDLHSAVTLGTANGLSLSGQALSLGLASTSSTGALSSTDWNTFNGKQNALTNPITGSTLLSGNTGDGYIPRASSSQQITNSLIYDNGTNVGIGTASPSRKLQVETSGNDGIHIQTTNEAQLTMGAYDSTSSIYYCGYDGTGLYYTAPASQINKGSLSGITYPINYYSGGANGNNSYLAFQTQSSEKMRITSSGNVGIGTTSPAQKLDVFGTSRISNTTPTQEFYSTGNADVWGSIYAQASGTGSGASLVFSTKRDGNSATDKMIITQGGNVGIGTTSPSGLWSGTNKTLQITGGSGVASELVQSRPSATITRFLSGTADTFGVYTADALNYEVYTSNVARMRITSGGNVGIGTTSPNSNSNRTTLTLNNNTWGGQLDINVGGVNHAQFGTDNFNSGLSCRIQSQDGIVFNAGGATERMRITSGGNVGIGTTSPVDKLDVNGIFRSIVTSISSTGEIAAKILGYPTSPFGLIFRSYSSGATSIQSQREASNSELFPLLLQPLGGNVGIGTTSPLTALTVSGNLSLFTTNQIRLYNSAKNNWTQVDSPLLSGDTEVDFRVLTKTGTFYINAAGNVGIGTTSPSYQLQLSTDSAAKPTSALWTIASDERIKENINSYTKGLNELLKINPITYDYNGLGGFKKGKGGVGIIAQEIAEILPDSVSSIKGKLNETDEEEIDILNFNGHELTYILINAVKEQNEVLKQLKVEIEILKNK